MADDGKGGDAGAEGAAGGDAGKTYTQAELAAAIAAEVGGLKTKNTELLGKLSAAKPVLDMLGDQKPEEVKAALEFARKAREDQAKAEGNYEALKGELLKQHAAEIDKHTKRTQRVEGKLYDVMARREAEAAIVAAGGNPKILLPHVIPAIKVAEDGDDFAVKVVDGRGNDRIAPDGTGTPMTIAQLVESFKADETFGVAFAASGASGGGARNHGGSGGATGAVVIPKNADTTTYRRMKAEAEKRGVPYTVGE